MGNPAERLQENTPSKGDGASTSEPRLSSDRDRSVASKKKLIISEPVRTPKKLTLHPTQTRVLKGEEPSFFHRYERKLYFLAILSVLAAVAWIFNEL